MIRCLVAIILLQYTIFISTSDLSESLSQVIAYAKKASVHEDRNNLSSVYVTGNDKVKIFTGWSFAQISFFNRSFGQKERMYISSNTQSHHFIHTPFCVFLEKLYSRLADVAYLDVQIGKDSWRFRTESVERYNFRTQLVGRKQ